MVELRVLGSTEIRRSGDAAGERIELPPKRFSLLAYLALARPRGLQRRDILCTMFWPESSHAGARNSLNQALHAIRRAIGEGAIGSRGREQVGLERGAVDCDAIAFESDLDGSRLHEALERYRGDLLPGLFARGALGFERWLEDERVRLRRRARDAAAELSLKGESNGDPIQAVRWLERALEIVPTDEAMLRRLIGLLHREGDRTGALLAYDRFADLLRSEYDTSPAPETEALMEGVRAHPRSYRQLAPATPEDKRVRSIAVLPLRDGGADETRAYSVEGMTEALVTELGRIRSLRVISYQSVRRFRQSQLTLREIAQALGVDALVEGSVLEAGGRVRVTAQLVRAEPEQHLWADAFEADAHDVISVHRDIARAVASSVAAAITAEDERLLAEPEQINPSAYHAYLQGWIRHATLLPTELAAAIPLYLEAIRLDPEFAPPRANLCLTQFSLLNMGELPLEETLDDIRRAARIVMKLDAGLAMTWTAQAALRIVEHDWAGAEESFRRAISIGPNESQTFTGFAYLLVGLGRSDEALEAAEQARRLDPLAPFANWIIACCLHYARRSDEAIRQLHRVLELFAEYPLAWIFLAKCHHQLGNRGATIEACHRSLQMLPENPMTLAYTTHMLAQAGEPETAEHVMERFEQQRRRRGFAAPFYTASALCGLGRIDEALHELDRIDTGASTTGCLLAVDPLLDPLRARPAFLDLLRRLGLPVLPM